MEKGVGHGGAAPWARESPMSEEGSGEVCQAARPCVSAAPRMTFDRMQSMVTSTPLRILLALALYLGAPPPSASSQERPRDTTGPEWRVDPQPDLALGSVDGPEEYLFVNVIDGASLSDGTIVLALFHRNFFRLRYYDEDGGFITSAGRWGEGPFELTRGFGSLGVLPGDSLLIVSSDHRYHVFGPRGEEARSGRLPLPAGSMPRGAVGPHHVALQDPQPRTTPAEGVTSYDWSFSVFDARGEEMVSLGALPGSRSALGEGGLILRLPFEPRPHWKAGKDRFWFGHSARPWIEGYDPADETRRRIHVDRPPRPVSGTDEERWKEFDLRRASDDVRGEFARHHRGLDFPETFPYFQGIDVDQSGNVWILRYQPPWSESPYLWDVFDPAGTRIATVVIPFDVLGPRLRDRPGLSPLLEIGEDYVLVMGATGPYDVIQVRRHRIIKETPGS